MIKIFGILAFAFVASFAGTNISNWTGLSDSCIINTFRADSIKFTKAFNYGDFENKLAVFVFDDSLHAGRANDSVVCEIGYQTGVPVRSTAGVYDTTWTYLQPLDTISTLVSNRMYDPSKYNASAPVWDLDPSQGVNVRPSGMIDTTIGGASSAVTAPQLPFYYPLGRFYVRGMTGNCGTFIRCHFEFTQRIYAGVRTR
jgi:hypothetical protein